MCPLFFIDGSYVGESVIVANGKNPAQCLLLVIKIFYCGFTEGGYQM